MCPSDRGIVVPHVSSSASPPPIAHFPDEHVPPPAHPPSGTLAEIMEFIKELDSDGDGGVSWEEYVQGLFSQDLDDGDMPEELAAALGNEYVAT